MRRPAATRMTTSLSPSSCMLALSHATEMVPVGCFSTRASSNCTISWRRLQSWNRATLHLMVLTPISEEKTIHLKKLHPADHPAQCLSHVLYLPGCFNSLRCAESKLIRYMRRHTDSGSQALIAFCLMGSCYPNILHRRAYVFY